MSLKGKIKKQKIRHKIQYSVQCHFTTSTGAHLPLTWTVNCITKLDWTGFWRVGVEPNFWGSGWHHIGRSLLHPTPLNIFFKMGKWVEWASLAAGWDIPTLPCDIYTHLLLLFVCWLWEKSRVPGENPRYDGENISTPHIKVPARIKTMNLQYLPLSHVLLANFTKQYLF